jgi:uncharacterized membrane protein YagU involved in acid resistance
LHFTSHSVATVRIELLRPILVGGAIAGTLDKISGFISFGLRSPLGIAAGLLGLSAFQGGAGTWIVGLLLHFFIAFSVATVYCLASRRLEFLVEHWLVCGLFYGIAVFLVMNLVVLPLSALHLTGPYQLRGLIQGVLGHMLLVGLPISFSLRKFANELTKSIDGDLMAEATDKPFSRPALR